MPLSPARGQPWASSLATSYPVPESGALCVGPREALATRAASLLSQAAASTRAFRKVVAHEPGPEAPCRGHGAHVQAVAR